MARGTWDYSGSEILQEVGDYLVRLVSCSDGRQAVSIVRPYSKRDGSEGFNNVLFVKSDEEGLDDIGEALTAAAEVISDLETTKPKASKPKAKASKPKASKVKTTKVNPVLAKVMTTFDIDADTAKAMFPHLA